MNFKQWAHLQKHGKEKNYWDSVNWKITQYTSLGGSAQYCTADKHILYLILGFSFRLFFLCCSVNLFLMVAHGWQRRCSFKVLENYFTIYCGSPRSQPYEGHRLTALEMSWIMLFTNNRMYLDLSYPCHIVTLLGHCREHLWGWMNFVPHKFLVMSEPTIPSTQNTQQKFPDWKPFLWKTSLIIQI